MQLLNQPWWILVTLQSWVVRAKIGQKSAEIGKNQQKGWFWQFSKNSKCNYTSPVFSISLQLGTNIGLRNANNLSVMEFWMISKNGYFWPISSKYRICSNFGPKLAKNIHFLWKKSKIHNRQVVCIPKTWCCCNLSSVHIGGAYQKQESYFLGGRYRGGGHPCSKQK